MWKNKSVRISQKYTVLLPQVYPGPEKPEQKDWIREKMLKSGANKSLGIKGASVSLNQKGQPFAESRLCESFGQHIIPGRIPWRLSHWNSKNYSWGKTFHRCKSLFNLFSHSQVLSQGSKLKLHAWILLRLSLDRESDADAPLRAGTLGATWAGRPYAKDHQLPPYSPARNFLWRPTANPLPSN